MGGEPLPLTPSVDPPEPVLDPRSRRGGENSCGRAPAEASRSRISMRCLEQRRAMRVRAKPYAGGEQAQKGPRSVPCVQKRAPAWMATTDERRRQRKKPKSRCDVGRVGVEEDLSRRQATETTFASAATDGEVTPA
ncbi:hypothetical protein U9M48_005043 [Paspalum notatum var. saurae]|uniref:Uncharacterized protein n=1 Tax=Paspalum notatum var. saurae TaxID=547442 RepID=A0AAQ3PPZ1_PASNO